MKPLVFDLETSIGKTVHGPDFRDPKNDFYTVITGNSPENIVITHKKEGFGRILPPEQQFKCSDVIVGHNLGFDLSYIWHNKDVTDYFVSGGKIWDTQVAEYILTAQQHLYSSLAELQEKHLGMKQKIDRISKLYARGVGADKIVRSGIKHRRLWNMYNEYCRLDGATTLQIFKKQYILAKEKGMLDIIWLHQDYLLALINMSCAGIQLDLTLCEKSLTEFNLKHIEYLGKAQEIVLPLWNNKNLPDFNINSPDHKSAVLFGGEIKNKVRTLVGKYKNGNDKYKYLEHKIWVDVFSIPKKITEETKKEGVYKTDNGVMQKIASKTKNTKLQKYCEYQKEAMMYKKVAKTYVQAFLDLNIAGKIYPNFNNAAVVTGRLSSSKPNMQNISKRNKFGKKLHALFIAPTGWKCVQIDFSQLEIWVSAFLSGDEQLIKDLLSGIDMHCVRVGLMENCSYEHAVHMCKVEEDQEWIKKRTAAKTFSYQRAYGAGIKKLVEFTGLSQETVENLIEKEEQRYPKMSNFWKEVKESAENTLTISRAENISLSNRGKNVKNDVELLPIYHGNASAVYEDGEIQRIGYYKSITGKLYHFPQTGNVGKFGLRRSITPTIFKNYPMQGTAAEIQGATSAALLKGLLLNKNKIHMINEVHDSKWFYIKNDYIDLLIPKIRDIIENVPKIFLERFGIDVPFRFPIDIEIGDNFAEMSAYKER